jgi:hypothetical protein
MIDSRITGAERLHLDRVWADALEHSRSRPPLRKGDTGAARFHGASANRKLGPVDLVDVGGPRFRPVPRRPFVSSTYASIEATCPDSCEWKRKGCFADAGFTKIAGQLMDQAAKGRSGFGVMQEEARLIRWAFRGRRIPQDGARGGRDLRLHVGGDVDSARGAGVPGAAARDWRRRGGGAVWTFTHRWAAIPRAAWGPAVSVLASIEAPGQAAEAARQGYASALVVDQFASQRAYPIAPGLQLVPCPAETRGKTCAECRLCLDRPLLQLGLAIGFQAHGSGAGQMRERLVQIRSRA